MSSNTLPAVAPPSRSEGWLAGEAAGGYDAAAPDGAAGGAVSAGAVDLTSLVEGLDAGQRRRLGELLTGVMGEEERARLVRRTITMLPAAPRETIATTVLGALSPDRRTVAAITLCAGLDDAHRAQVGNAARPATRTHPTAGTDDAPDPVGPVDPVDPADPAGGDGEAGGAGSTPAPAADAASDQGSSLGSEGSSGSGADADTADGGDAGLAALAQLAGGVDAAGALTAIGLLLDRVAADPLSGAVDDGALLDSVKALTRAGHRVAAERRRRIGELDDRQAHRGRARSLSDLLADELGLTRSQAKQEAETAATLKRLPRTAARAAAGEIGAAQADVAARAARRLDTLAAQGAPVAPDAVDRLDAHTATHAPASDTRQLQRSTTALTDALSPAALAERDRRLHHDRRVWLGTTTEGVPTLEARLSVTGYAALDAALQPLARKQGRDDPRSYPQRLHDALVELATRALDAGELPQQTRQRPHLLLITRRDDPAPAHLDSIGPVSDDTADLIACHADTSIITTHSCGSVCDVQPGHTDPTRAMTRAVLARDKGCVGCGADISRCQLHHITYRRHGGVTAIANLATVCWSCHHEIHHGDRTITITPTGPKAPRQPHAPTPPPQRPPI